MAAPDRDAALRAALFEHLDELAEQSPDGSVHAADVNGLRFEGRPFQVMGQQGIRKVAGLDAALSFYTVYRAAGAERPYEDEVGPDGLLRYKYQGSDPNNAANTAMRRAMELELPVAYFSPVAPGVYAPHWPSYVVGEDPDRLEFTIKIDPAQQVVPQAAAPTDIRRYNARLTRQRLHQVPFRNQVLRAYSYTCAVCGLAYPEVIDAAHIVGDTDPLGLPIVPNGLALCRLHHAAYDRYLLGVRPDRTIEIRPDVLAVSDGPALLDAAFHAVNERTLRRPRYRRDDPDPARLDWKYARFRDRCAAVSGGSA